MKQLLRVLFFIFSTSIYSQNNFFDVEAELHPQKNTIEIKQEITFYNKSNNTLYELVFRNWGNSYKNDDTPLAKRLLEDYKTDFYFSRKNERGYSNVHSVEINNKKTSFHTPKHIQDLVFVNLSQPLKPNEHITVKFNYTVKIPHSKFTGSGKKGPDYFLEDWYITPSIYDKKWLLDTHNNLNYQYVTPSDYQITFKTPIGYKLYSNLTHKSSHTDSQTIYHINGNNQGRVKLSIRFLSTYLEVPTYPANLVTNFISDKIDISLQKIKMQEMMFFLKEYLGNVPNRQLLIEKYNYNKNPIYELKYLPKFLHPYSKEFKWEAEFFKALANEYVSHCFIHNKNKDHWFDEGLEVYLFMKYIEQQYPDSKIIGRLAKIWGIRKLNIAQQSFNSKFSIIHQITARENLDQSLSTSLKDFSNFNQKIISPYKAGLGFVFLQEYVGKKNLKESIYQYSQLHKSKFTNSNEFLNILEKNSAKDISWFDKEWIQTSKKIDHKIKAIHFKSDSVTVTLKNKRSIKTPVLVYGLKGKTIKSKTWVNGFSDTKTVTIKNDSLDKVVLNYENSYPEINTSNNWKNQKAKLFERPLQVSLLKDLNNPRKHQVFLKPEMSYNYYDGVLLGLSIQNKAYLNKNFEYALKPNYATKSRSLTGGFTFDYSIFPENTNVYLINFGINGSNYHYAENLNYNTLSPFISLSFKQKNFRALGTNKISARFLAIDKEVAPGEIVTDQDSYHLLKLDYSYRKNKLIHDYRLNVNTEIANKFSKINTDFRYRHLTNNKRPIEFRFYGGVFLTNNTETDYFSFNQHTPNDYLFELPYLGRSETSGLISQQYFKSEGGFVTKSSSGFANQWLTSVNTSVGIWRWVEAFNSASLLKSKGSAPEFDYEGGIRLNFIPDILEFYLPLYNKQGIVTQQDNYLDNVRFIITLKPQPIANFLKQQLF